MTIFEHKSSKLATLPKFIGRSLLFLLFGLLLVSLALLIGVLGYHDIAGLGWIDALLNASMLLGGMGPVNVLVTDSAKIFASCYALFSGLVFIAVMGVILAPAIHRLLHHFHVDKDE